MPWRDEPPSDLSANPLYETYSGPDSGLVRFGVRALGTDNVFLLAAAGGPELRSLAQDAFELLERLERRLSKFQPDSDVAMIQQLAHATPVSVGDETLELLRVARRAWELSGGAFDPTVGPLLAAWGLVDMSGRVPSDAELARARALTGFDRVEVDDERGTVRVEGPGVSIDFGGIGKGYVVDRLVSLFRARGVAAGAVVSGRSTLAFWGAPPGLDAWEIEISDPVDPRGQGLGQFRAEPGVVSSSGAAERSFRRGGEVYGHVIDPRDGRPVRALEGTTVWTTNAVAGDILSTALYVLGPSTLGAQGPIARLVTELAGGRATLGWIEAASGVWGGRRLAWHAIGEPGLRPVDRTSRPA